MSSNFLYKLLLITAVMLATVTSPLAAGPFTSVVVYGDSLSDNGNLFNAVGLPGAPYFQGRRSNGPVAVEQLASALGVPLVDFAWIGATTGIGNYADLGTPTSSGAFGLPGMQVEFAGSTGVISPYLAGGLFIVWGGANDFLSPSPLDTTPQQIVTRAVNDLLGIVTGLRTLGAQNILVPGIPDLGLSPFFRGQGAVAAAQASAITDLFNSTLRAGLPQGVLFYDSAALLRAMTANPSAYGFTNVAEPCFNGSTVCANPGQYLFFDDFHPTFATNTFVAAGFQATATPEPAAFVLVGAGLLLIGWRKALRR